MAEVQSVRQLPAEFIEALGKTYADELTKTVGGLKTIDVSKLYGPQFVAGPGAFTTEAEKLSRWIRFLCTLPTRCSTSTTSSCRFSWTSSLSSLYVSIPTRCNSIHITRI
jgi:hypothetical protein